MASTLGPRPEGRVPQLVSVIIPVRDGAATLVEQLDALRSQDHDGPWELVLADNGSTDATVSMFRDVVGRAERAGTAPWTDARVVVAADRRGPAHARNAGAADARGDLWCFCDADDVVDRAWLGELVRVAADHHLVAGRLDLDALNAPRTRSWRPTPATASRTAAAFVPSGNMAIWAETFVALGGFTEDLRTNEDVELSERARDEGAAFGFAPDAVVHYRLRSTLRGVAGQSYRNGRSVVQTAAGRGSVPPVRISAVGRRLGWSIVRLPYLVSADRRGLWVRRTAEVAGTGVELARWSLAHRTRDRR